MPFDLKVWITIWTVLFLMFAITNPNGKQPWWNDCWVWGKVWGASIILSMLYFVWVV
jgi:hypothetical protein